MKEKTKQLGTLFGTAITAACCLGLPVVISALTAIGVGFLIHDAILVPMFMGFIGFNLWMLNRSARQQENCPEGSMTPFKLAAIGGGVSIFGLLLSVSGIGLGTLLIYIGLGVFFLGNYRAYKGNPHTC